MGNVEVTYSLMDDFHNKNLQCSDIRADSIEMAHYADLLDKM